MAPQNPTSTIHSSYSSAREKLLEHVFVGELLGALWRRGEHRAEVLRPEVDSGGYDLVVVANGIVRHIQLKASHLGAKTDEVSVSTALAVKPSGCVVWIRFDADTMRLGPFLWFGGGPGTPLPDLGTNIGRHTKGDSTGRKSKRPSKRTVKRGRFARLPTIDALIHHPFGEMPSA